MLNLESLWNTILGNGSNKEYYWKIYTLHLQSKTVQGKETALHLKEGKHPYHFSHATQVQHHGQFPHIVAGGWRRSIHHSASIVRLVELNVSILMDHLGYL